MCAQQSVKVSNIVTLGATLLSNSTDTYASFAVLVDQALGRAVRFLTLCMQPVLCRAQLDLV